MVRKKGASRNSPALSTSVIIPAYNAENYLPFCLDALLQQSRLPDEIIVVDDGSTDNTKGVAGAYSLVILLTQKNGGPAKARNAGAKKARSNIIIFLDSDCVPEKDWLANMIAPFEDEKVVGVQGAYKTKQKEWVARFDQLDIEYRYERMKRSKRLDWIGSYSAAYRKDIFLAQGGFDESFTRASGEDAELSYRLAEKGMVLIFNPQAIVYHTHPSSFWKFLDVEYFRAYWRMRMYVKHPLKAVRDSYTPQSLKVAVFLGAALVVGALVSLAIFIFQFHRFPNVLALINLGLAISLGGILGANLAFLLFLFSRDFILGFFSILMIFTRAIVFGIGVLRGFLDEKVRA
jgi:glycosyltransferase involved in cell wall biosynthesis